MRSSPVTENALKQAREQKFQEVRSGPIAPFLATADALARILILPSADLRRVVEETMPNLPQELGGGPITVVTQGVQWAAVAFEDQPKLAVHLVVQSRDADAAQALSRLVEDARKLAKQALQAHPLPPDLAGADLPKALDQIQPKVVQDRLVLDLDLERASALIGAPSARPARPRSAPSA